MSNWLVTPVVFRPGGVNAEGCAKLLANALNDLPSDQNVIQLVPFGTAIGSAGYPAQEANGVLIVSKPKG
jgi:hypothetical protein